MALIMLNGVAYSTPLVEIQNNSSATSLDALKIPTGQTVESYLNNSFYVKAGKKSGTTLGTKATTEGNNNTASGNYSHAEGSGNTASGAYAHAEGNDCIASGFNSHAEGNDARASGMYTHAEGYSTRASSNYQHVQGKYNVGKSNSLFEIGNGTADNARSNAFEVTENGDVFAGRSNGIDVTNEPLKNPTSQDIVSYLNSILGNYGLGYYANATKLYDIIQNAKINKPFFFIGFAITEVNTLMGSSTNLYFFGVSWISSASSSPRTICFFPDVPSKAIAAFVTTPSTGNSVVTWTLSS